VTIALLAALVVFSLASLLSLREAWRTWQPTRLLRVARYHEAALHLSGDLEESVRVLAPLHEEKLRGQLRYALCAVDAANLVLLDRDHRRASALLDEARRIYEPVEDILLAAHAKLGAGEPEEAATLFAKAAAKPFDDHQPQTAIIHTLRGLYLTQMGSAAEARAELSLAAETPLTNVYVRRARAALELTPSDPGDPRSSLAPQVVPHDSE
jgi:hypothetical protein